MNERVLGVGKYRGHLAKLMARTLRLGGGFFMGKQTHWNPSHCEEHAKIKRHYLAPNCGDAYLCNIKSAKAKHP